MKICAFILSPKYEIAPPPPPRSSFGPTEGQNVQGREAKGKQTHTMASCQTPRSSASNCGPVTDSPYGVQWLWGKWRMAKSTGLSQWLLHHNSPQAIPDSKRDLTWVGLGTWQLPWPIAESHAFPCTPSSRSPDRSPRVFLVRHTARNGQELNLTNTIPRLPNSRALQVIAIQRHSITLHYWCAYVRPAL